MGLVKFPAPPAPILVDASFLIAVYDRRAAYHPQCMSALARVNQSLVTCEAVVTEAMHLLRHMSGAPEAILTSIRKGELEIPFQLAPRVGEVLDSFTKYRDTPCDFADACLIQMANELGTGDILTLDSDFKHYRWRRNRRFNLLIPLD